MCCPCSCFVIAPVQMLLAQPGIGQVIRDHQCAWCCHELEPCLTGAFKQTAAAMLEGCTMIDVVAAALGSNVSRDAKTGKLCSDDAGGPGPGCWALHTIAHYKYVSAVTVAELHQVLMVWHGLPTHHLACWGSTECCNPCSQSLQY